MSRADDLLRLAFVGMHPERRARLLEEYGEPAAVLSAIRTGRVEVPDYARRAAAVPADRRRAELVAAGILVATRPSFPGHLAALPDSPDLLFMKGTMAAERGVAVVGSRRATSYGLSLARAYGAALGAAGWPVVSGLARGIDGATHQGTVEAGGRGTAVLGCGVDMWYPPEHQKLGEQLLAAGGGIISEYPPGAPPLGWRFPPRNRIISGLSGAVVIVEAARRGGALITARLALHQGREVLAVPGDVHRTTSQGCNLLIRDGAIPVMDPDDLVEAISLILGPPASSRPEQEPTDELVDALGGVGRTVDWLADHFDLPVSEVLARVSKLEATGVVMRSGAMITRGNVAGL